MSEIRRKTFNPRSIDDWKHCSPYRIAKDLDYFPDKLFKQALAQFITEIISITTITTILPSVAEGFFRSYGPPHPKRRYKLPER